MLTGDRFDCRRCGMSFRLTCPLRYSTRRQERLVCSECGIVYGVSMNREPKKSHPVICWLIREGGVRRLKGVKKIA